MGIEVKINIPELLEEYHLSLRELSRLTDIVHSSLSPLSNQKRQNIHLPHIERICEALDITDPCKIFTFTKTEE